MPLITANNHNAVDSTNTPALCAGHVDTAACCV